MVIGVCRYGNEANVVLHGTLTHTDTKAFQKVFDLTNEAQLDAIYLDFLGLSAIDDAGLGLLMMLRSRARAKLKRVALCRARGEVAKTLAHAKFDTLFA